MSSMFCRQCEQTSGGKGCTVSGVCGKKPETAALQDLLTHAMIGIGHHAHALRSKGLGDPEADRFLMRGLFTTVTNVNFDPETLKDILFEASSVLARVSARRDGAAPDSLPEEARWKPSPTLEGLIDQGEKAGIVKSGLDFDAQSLRELALYGLRGMAAYAHHASRLGREREDVSAFFSKGLAALSDRSLGAGPWLDLVLELGRVNLECLRMLDEAHVSRFGHPMPTKVSLGARKGPALLVSGHDLLDLEDILRKTEGTGVSVYTHGEMLPAHGYPALNKHPHLAGHYGGAWQNQRAEFAAFPGPIVMTTNCVQQPLASTLGRLFTTGLVRWPGAVHIKDGPDGKDFGPVVAKALELGGFAEEAPGKSILAGFARNAILGHAGRIVELVRSGKIRRFFLIGGCDGAKPGRDYFTRLAESLPPDCVVLTLACGKFRFNTLDFGDIDGIPRLLDCGQCNDAYSAIAVAGELAKAFGCSVNDLPLSLVLSWYEQKAVCILISLLSLGIKNIRLGPSLPAFVSPNVLKTLAEKFSIKPTGTASGDLEDILGAAKTG
jgi:hydroxylamine reductase